MKFLESTNFFVRITIYDYIHALASNKLKFRIIPMVHVGEEGFYKTIKEKILECDEIIYEGIRRKKLIQKFNPRRDLCEKLDLMLQKDAFLLKGVNLKLTHGDYSEKESAEEWKKVRLFERLKDRILNPIERYYFNTKMTRRKLAKYFGQSYEDYYLAYGPRFDEAGTTENFYYARREQKVLDIILDRVLNESKEDKIIGILYGAGHMNRISRNLIDVQGYRVSHGQFAKVFDVK